MRAFLNEVAIHAGAYAEAYFAVRARARAMVTGSALHRTGLRKEASELAKQAGMLSAKDRAFDAIDTAESEGKINADEARDLRLSALRKMVGDSGSADAAVDSSGRRVAPQHTSSGHRPRPSARDSR